MGGGVVPSVSLRTVSLLGSMAFLGRRLPSLCFYHLRLLHWLWTTGSSSLSLVGGVPRVLLWTLPGRSGYQSWRWLCTNCGVPSPPEGTPVLASLRQSRVSSCDWEKSYQGSGVGMEAAQLPG